MFDELVNVEMGAANIFYIFGAGSEKVPRQRPSWQCLSSTHPMKLRPTVRSSMCVKLGQNSCLKSGTG